MAGGSAKCVLVPWLLSFLFFGGVVVAPTSAFTTSPPLLRCRSVVQSPTTSSTTTSSTTVLGTGLFDGLKKAFANEEYATPPEGVKASARHILVKTKEEANLILQELVDGQSTSFASLAREYSLCPSGTQQGGSLGTFKPQTMVPEFDQVVFNPQTQIGEIVGPIQTKFGYHLIVVDNRTGM